MAVEKNVDEKDEGEEYVAVEETADTRHNADESDDVDSDDDSDDSDEADGGHPETRLGGGREEDEDESKAGKKGHEKKTRGQLRREARERTERELRFLQRRNEQLERRFSTLEMNLDQRVTGSEVANIDSAINKSRSDLALANSVIAQAVEANDGRNLAEALEHRDSIRDSLRDLNEAKQYLSQQGGRPHVERAPIDPRHKAHADRFMVEHSWWRPDGQDADSQTVLAIDRSLVQEGFDPAEADYWDELRARTKAALPGKFKRTSAPRDSDDYDDAPTNGRQKNRQKGPQFRTGGRERPLKRNEVYISPERKEAMIEAGVWDDPVLRSKYLKAYAQYDRGQQESVGA